eukprot:9477145-Pyramimonas_sp.AAC.1
MPETGGVYAPCISGLPSVTFGVSTAGVAFVFRERCWPPWCSECPRCDRPADLFAMHDGRLSSSMPVRCGEGAAMATAAARAAAEPPRHLGGAALGIVTSRTAKKRRRPT